MYEQGEKEMSMSKLIANKLAKKESIEDQKEIAPMESVMAELILGIQERDVEMAVKAFKSLFQLCELEPHEEGNTEKGPTDLLISGEL